MGVIGGQAAGVGDWEAADGARRRYSLADYLDWWYKTPLSCAIEKAQICADFVRLLYAPQEG